MLSLLLNNLLGEAPSTQIYMISLLAIQCLFTFVLILYMRRSVRRKQRLTTEEKAQLLANFEPEPLVPDADSDDVSDNPALRTRLISGRVGRRVCVNGHDCLNMASQNFLGLLDDVDGSRERKAVECINRNGVGACGPRGFYGTNDVHLQLEEQLAAFFGCEEAAIYAYGFSALASAIPSYCKRGDLVFVDERVNFAIQKGLDMSRSTCVYFRHNDVADLERILLAQQQKDRRNPKKAAAQRRFLITEAIFQNTGEMCPLAQLVKLRGEHKLRFILDESLSFGVVGKTGKGLTELLNVDMKEVDLIIGTLETAIGSIGGFCVGTTYIVDHQRLSGLGYCFSASSPPFLASVALQSLQELKDQPHWVADLNDRAEKVHESFGKLSMFTLGGHPISPVKHLYLIDEANDDSVDRSRSDAIIESIVNECMLSGLALTAAEYLTDKELTPCPKPSIRLAVCRLLSDEDIQFAFDTLERVSLSVVRVN